MIKCSNFDSLNFIVIFGDAWFQIETMYVCSLTVCFLVLMVFSWHPFLADAREGMMDLMAIWFHQLSDFCMGCSTAPAETTEVTSFFLPCGFADLFRLFWLTSHTVLTGHGSESEAFAFPITTYKGDSCLAQKNLVFVKATEDKPGTRQLKTFSQILYRKGYKLVT